MLRVALFLGGETMCRLDEASEEPAHSLRLALGRSLYSAFEPESGAALEDARRMPASA